MTPAVLRVEATAWHSEAGELARGIRFEVFVHEQGVPASEEVDAIDERAYHCLAYGAGGEALGTARFFSDAEGRAHIGRMAVRREARGRGVGLALLRHLVERAGQEGYREIILSAQTHAIPFYERCGFKAYGPEYLDCAIPHRDMRREL